MKRLWLSLAALLLIAGCGKEGGKSREGTKWEKLTAETANADTVYARIMRQSPYSKYANWPNHQGLQPGSSPHGAFHVVYINPVIEQVLPATNKKIPAGGIIVKENYSQDKQLMALTVMVKMEDGYYPQGGDWFWAKYDVKEGSRMGGKLDTCAECHAPAKDNDYVLLQPLDK